MILHRSTGSSLNFFVVKSRGKSSPRSSDITTNADDVINDEDEDDDDEPVPTGEEVTEPP